MEIEKNRNKIDTFFFKEYEGIVERNTYSAYIPDKKKSIWTLVVDDEKCRNFAKIGVESILKRYFQNDEINSENIFDLMVTGLEKIKERKQVVRKKLISNKISKTSIIVVLIEKNRLLVGNIGKNKLKIFRENMIIEEIFGDEIKEIAINKNDYILVGTSKFWKLINENEIVDALIRWNSKGELENYISEKVMKSEKKLNMTIPFFSIFIEDILQEDEEVCLMKKDYGDDSLKNILLMLIFLFSFVVFGKNMAYRKMESEAEKHLIISENYFKNKKFVESMKEIDFVIDKYRNLKSKDKNVENKIDKLLKKRETIDLESKKIFLELENKKLLEERKRLESDVALSENPEKVKSGEISKNHTENKDKMSISENSNKNENLKSNLEKSNVKIYEKNRRKKKEIKAKILEKGFKTRKSVKKEDTLKIGKVSKSRKFKNLNSNYSLDEEIKRNWKILGRDVTGNKN